jgi:hypothetical protein
MFQSLSVRQTLYAYTQLQFVLKITVVCNVTPSHRSATTCHGKDLPTSSRLKMQHVPLKRGCSFTRIFGVKTRRTVIFILTAVKPHSYTISGVSFCVRTDNHGNSTKFISYKDLTYAETKLRPRHNLEATHNSRIK